MVSSSLTKGETRREKAKLSEISSYSSNDSFDGLDDISLDFDGLVVLHHHHEHAISNWGNPPPFWELQTQPWASFDGLERRIGQAFRHHGTNCGSCIVARIWRRRMAGPVGGLGLALRFLDANRLH